MHDQRVSTSADGHGTALSRRHFMLAATSALLLTGCASAPSGPSEQAGPTIPQLLRGKPFYIAHRGSADNWPEHTLTAYERATAAGARALDVSIRATADGVLVCHHDPNLKRMTGHDLEIADVPFSALEPLRNDARAWLGPASELAPIPRLEDVLDTFAQTHVLFIEDKQLTNTGALLDLMGRYPGSRDRFVWKQAARETQHTAAAKQGYRTWGYFDQEDFDRIEELAPAFDYLGISHLAPDDVVARVVAQGKTVICWAVHTRAMRDRMLGLGVAGMMCSNIPYVTSTAALDATDQFATGLRAAGDLPWTVDQGWEVQPTIDPRTATVTIGGEGGSSYCMGSMCPLAGEVHSLLLELRWPDEIPDEDEHAGIAFGQADDSAYRVRVPSAIGGYHLVMRGSGVLDLYSREAGEAAGTRLATMRTDPPEPGRWIPLRVELAPEAVGFARTDGKGWHAVVQDSTFRGGYFSLTKNYPAGPDVQFRSIQTA